MPPGCLPLQVFQARPTGRRFLGDPERAGEVILYISLDLGSPFNRLENTGQEMSGLI